MGGKQVGVPGSKSVHNPKPRQELIAAVSLRVVVDFNIHLKMGTRQSELLASLQTLEDQLICFSAGMLFREVSVGWRKSLRNTS